MDDQLRRQYLEAMGITSWVVRQSDEAEVVKTPAGAEFSAQLVKPAALQPEVSAEDSPPPWVTDAPPPDEGSGVRETHPQQKLIAPNRRFGLGGAAGAGSGL